MNKDIRARMEDLASNKDMMPNMMTVRDDLRQLLDFLKDVEICLKLDNETISRRMDYP